MPYSHIKWEHKPTIIGFLSGFDLLFVLSFFLGEDQSLRTF